MPPKLKTYFLILLLAELLFAYAPAFAQSAQVTTAPYDYSQTVNGVATNPVSTQIESYLCNPKAGGSGVLYQCINQIYKFSIVLASVIGVFFIVIAGYVYMSADGNSESVDKAKSIIESTIVSLVILLGGFVFLNTINPDLVQFHGNTLQPVNITAPSGGVVTLPAGCSTSYCVVDGFNIGPYATAPTHEALVISVYNQIANQDFSSASSIDQVLKSLAPSTPLTGSMVLSAAQSYNVDPKLMVALMQVDSNLGTQGLGAQTGNAAGGYNPGNVGNNGVTTKNYGSWQAGVNAVASWLNSNRA